MRWARVLASAVIVVLALGTLWRLCVRPYRCDVAFVDVRDATARAYRSGGSAIMDLHAHLPRVFECLPCEPYSVHWQMLAAAALDMTGRRPLALSVAERALRWDRRPELYSQAAHLQAAAGQHQKSIESIRQAVLFNPAILDGIREGGLREHAHRALREHYVAAGNLIRNSFFERRLPFGRIEFTGTGQGPDSVAAGWFLFTSSPGTVKFDVVPSTRPGGRTGMMAHLVVSSPLSGISQVWGPADRGPSAVTTSAWVYVVKGNVFIGSGQLANVSFDTVIGYSGQWRRIEGRSGTCPVSQTSIGAASADTEFYVTEVEARAVADAPACETPG